MANDTVSIVVPLVLLALLLLVVLLFCCHNGRLVSPQFKWNYYKNIWAVRQIDVFIKRCEQVTTRKVEDTIIRTVGLKGQTWSQHEFGPNPVVVFCVISSRVGTDIDSAMRGVNEYSPVILVLLHFQNKHQLGNKDLSDTEYLLDERTKQRMVGFAHFAFSDDEGLYACAQNNFGFQRVAELVKEAGRQPVHGLR